tara:strand:+ start:129 stop:440 length:312 start_codon:yes stop_codon:yes gene_type:complete
MKKFFLISGIFILILLTAIIKNSTKEIEDNIFITKENLRILNNEFGNLALEYNFLSSSEKLLKYQSIYFENELVKKNLDQIKIIHNYKDNLFIKNLEISKNEN